jgi:hypothetical protein
VFKRGFTRLGRAIGLDRNPLRRATDRTEAWIRAGLVAVFQPDQAGAGARRAAGRPVHGPAVLVEGLTLVVMTLALTGALWLTRALLTRRRLAAWEAAWSRIGPQWSRNRP